MALVPSRSGETFGLAAAEAMASGLPVVASRVGALPELIPDEWLVPAGDPRALAAAIERLRARAGQAGALAIEQARRLTEPAVVSEQLARIYAAVDG
jgi:glycosyltransferase involved in cell wall biosynthesis